MDTVQNKKNIFEGVSKVAIVMMEGEADSTLPVIRLCKCDEGEFLHNYFCLEFAYPEIESDPIKEILNSPDTMIMVDDEAAVRFIKTNFGVEKEIFFLSDFSKSILEGHVEDKKLLENLYEVALAIDSFRNISKDKIMEFVSLIPNMDKDLAIAIVNQFPAYTEFATTAITVLKDMCDSALEKGEAIHMETIAAYRKLLDDLGEIAKRDNITEEERKFLTEQMIIVADKIGEKDTEFKNFISGVLKYVTTILGGAIIIGAAILGVNIKGKDIPILKK